MPIPHQVADAILVVERQGVADGNPQLAGKLLADDGAAAIERERPTTCAFAHLHETLQLLRVLGADQLQAMLGAAIGGASDLVLSGNPSELLVIRADRIRHRILSRLVGFVGIHAHNGVEAIHFAVLLIDDVVDGVLQPQACEQQRGAARDADDSHEEAALVAEQVSRRDLPAERHPAPQRADALEQDALARLRGTRQHQRCGALAQGGRRREPRCGHGDAHAQAGGACGNARVHGSGHARHHVHDGIRVHDEPR